jgi:pimeloyl-ACP methyl ester carboxylesterase
LLDWLEIPQAVVVGHWLGGLIALRLALRHPNRVASLVLVDGGGVPLTRVRLAMVTTALKGAGSVMGRQAMQHVVTHRPRLRRAALSAFLHEPAQMTGPMTIEMLSTFGAKGLPGAVAAGAAGAADDAMTHNAEITMPVLLVWGRHDCVLPLRIAERMAEELSECGLEVFEDSGHCPMLEEPQRFNDVLRAWADR